MNREGKHPNKNDDGGNASVGKNVHTDIIKFQNSNVKTYKKVYYRKTVSVFDVFPSLLII